MELHVRILLIAFLLSTHALAGLPAKSTISIQNRIFSFYANKNIEIEQSNVEHAVITIHGSARNPDTYFKSVWGISKKLKVENKTLILSPHFKITGDQLLKNELKFTYEGWWIGNNSIDGSNVSSFSVIDFFIKHFANKDLFPNLKTLVITGHSAGGHLTQRLALGSIADLGLEGLDIKYIVANPGTYAYLTRKRPVAGQEGIFEIPRNIRCAYNRYKYGMEQRNSYMSRDSVKNMAKRFISREVVYFLGERDLGEVEQNCQASIQGPHRFSRGKNFYAHINEEYPTNIHHMITVPDVGHTQYGMYTSELGKKLLFNL